MAVSIRKWFVTRLTQINIFFKQKLTRFFFIYFWVDDIFCDRFRSELWDVILLKEINKNKSGGKYDFNFGRRSINKTVPSVRKWTNPWQTLDTSASKHSLSYWILTKVMVLSLSHPTSGLSSTKVLAVFWKLISSTKLVSFRTSCTRACDVHWRPSVSTYTAGWWLSRFPAPSDTFTHLLPFPETHGDRDSYRQQRQYQHPYHKAVQRG
jgi:hypothetical protein